jgi:hypothetical protein
VVEAMGLLIAVAVQAGPELALVPAEQEVDKAFPVDDSPVDPWSQSSCHTAVAGPYPDDPCKANWAAAEEGREGDLAGRIGRIHRAVVEPVAGEAVVDPGTATDSPAVERMMIDCRDNPPLCLKMESEERG